MYVATIGFFDGVHRGHRYLIDQVRAVAAERQMQSLIITFVERPRAVLHAEYIPELLTTPEEKALRLKSMGVDRVEMLHFTSELSMLSAREYMEDILRDRLGVKVLIMGYDHGFGHNGGTPEGYQRWGSEVGIEIIRGEELRSDSGTPCHTHISSSTIRHLLKEGHVAEANSLLGHNYSLQGRVVRGFQVGRRLGFPTANLQPHCHKLVPGRGVYAVHAYLDGGERHPGMLNIGERPTIGLSQEQSIEVNLLGFHGDLYDREMTVEFVDFIRPEQKFDSPQALVEQIGKDQAEVMQRLQNQK